MRGLIAIVIVIARIGRADPGDSFKPPCAVREAQERFEHGKGLFESKRYADAAAEFAAAYQLDAHAKFLLFNLALARRMAGLCNDAIDAYRAFLDAGPPDALAKNARIGIERCESALAAARRTEPGHGDEPGGTLGDDKPGEKPSGDKVAGDKAADNKPLGDKTLGGTSSGAKPSGAKPGDDRPPVSIVDAPWHRDTLGVSLVAGGVACGLAGATLFLLAHSDANATFSPTSVAGYLDDRRAAGRLQTASWIAGGAGAALAIGGAIRFATRGHGTVAVTPAPAPAGAALVVEGRF